MGYHNPDRSMGGTEEERNGELEREREKMVMILL
jgi:hypothetical protein